VEEPKFAKWSPLLEVEPARYWRLPLSGWTFVAAACFSAAFYILMVQDTHDQRPSGIIYIDGVLLALVPFGAFNAAEDWMRRRVVRQRAGRKRRNARWVKLRIFRDEQPYARDEGWLEFDGAMLRYVGAQTSFSVATKDVWAPPAGSRKNEFIPGTDEKWFFGSKGARTAFGFRLAADPTYWIGFESQHVSNAVAKELFDWLEADVATDEPSLLPPREPISSAPWNGIYDHSIKDFLGGLVGRLSPRK